VFDEMSLQSLLNVHKLGCTVPKEDLHTFKRLLMDKPNGNCVLEDDSTILASDLFTIVGNRWLHYSILSGIVKLLQKENIKTCTLLLNDSLFMDAETLQKQVSKIVQSKPSSLTFVSRVGRSKEVFLSSPKRKGCHWTMTYVDLVSNSWFYCDTLGWNPPFDLKKEINRVLDAIDNIYCLLKKPYKKFFICHAPSSIYIHHHDCSSKCLKNFPFQTCGNVCGAIIAILAVVAQKVPNVWQKLSPTGNLPSGLKWLLEPTTYSDYLRKLISLG
jgi:hypothetical protein